MYSIGQLSKKMNIIDKNGIVDWHLQHLEEGQL